MTEIDSTMMRFTNLSGIPVEMATGGTAANLTDFPISYPLADFCRFYWRVKTWTITYDISLDIAEPGGTSNRSFSGSYSVTNSSGTDHRETDRIRDAQAWALTPGTSLGFSNGDLPTDSPQIVMQFLAVFCTAPDLPLIYGYYDLPEDGTPGFLIPRLVFSGILQYEPTPPGLHFNFRSSAFEVNPNGWYDGATWHPYSSGTDGTLTFDGHTIPIQWEASLDTESTITISSLNITVTAASYFEYSDGTTPFWNSATGEKI